MAFPRRKGLATLAAREQLTPRMIRVTLRADGFRDDWPLEQPGEIVTLLFAEPGREVVLPIRGWSFPPGAEDQPWRNYTVRRHRPQHGEIDVDVVLHEPRGPACTWAARAEIGATVGYAGPRVDFAPRADAAWLLLCGDETALPAIAAILETRPAAAVVEIHDDHEALDLGPRVTWVPRDGATAGTTSHLAEALQSIELPDGPGQVWAAAESMVAKQVRTLLRVTPGRYVKATGYWRLAAT